MTNKDIPTIGGKREGAGRKAVKIDLEELEKVYALQPSDLEAASWFGVSLRTLQKRRQQPKFAAAILRGRNKGRMKVRNAQMRMLDKGNPTIAIWLGKNLLGQSETPAIRISLPKIMTGQDLSQAAGRITQAAARGKITPTQGKDMMSILASHATIIVNVEVIGRIEKLEQNMAAAPVSGIAVVGLPIRGAATV